MKNLQKFDVSEEQQKKAFRLAYNLFEKVKTIDDRVEILNEALQIEKQADTKFAVYLIDAINKFIFDKLDEKLNAN